MNFLIQLLLIMSTNTKQTNQKQINQKQTNQTDIESQQTTTTNPKNQTTTNSKNKTATNSENDIHQGIINMLFFMFVIFVGAIPISQFVMAVKFKSEMSTSCNSFLTPFVWMIVNGVSLWIQLILPYVYLLNIFKSNKINKYLFERSILNYFRCAWIICGSVMFWRDCPHLENKTMNDFYWFVLIISILSCPMFYFQIRNDSTDDSANNSDDSDDE